MKDSSYYGEPRPEVHTLLPPSYDRVLEVGCGAGAFSRSLKATSETWGVEPVAGAAEKAARHLTRVLNGKYDDVAPGIPDDYFDLVICNDVIEHMDDHDRFLLSVRSKMRANGWIVGSVPNMRNYRVLHELLVRKDWQYRDYGILDRTHLRFFTEKSLRRALEGAGFRLEALVGMNSAIQSNDDALNVAKRLFFSCVSLATFGTYNDIRFLQFGFRARKAPDPEAWEAKQQSTS